MLALTDDGERISDWDRDKAAMEESKLLELRGREVEDRRGLRTSVVCCSGGGEQGDDGDMDYAVTDWMEH
jgi:hypothetical protein